MPADYPNTTYSPRTKENKPGVTYDPSKSTVGYMEDVTNLDDEVVAMENDLRNRRYSVLFIIDGGGSAITTGQKGHISIPDSLTIVGARLLADQSGSIVVDIWKDSYANFPPTDLDSITGSTPPTLSAAQKAEDTSLTGWTTAINAGDILAFNVDSASTVTRVTVALKVKRI